METFDKYLALRNFVNETEKSGLVYGTSFSEFLILRAVGAASPAGIRRVDLAEQVGLTVSGVTKALAPLEKQGYIETLDEVSDARVRKVAMTRSGGELFKDMERDMERKMANAHHHLSKLLREIA